MAIVVADSTPLVQDPDAIEIFTAGGNRTTLVSADGHTYPAPTSPKSSVLNVFNGSRTISASFFGLHVANQSTGVPRDIDYAWVRCHDTYGGTRWHTVNPSNGTFVYTNPDAFVDAFASAGKEILYLLGFTPDWASASTPNTGKYDNGTTARATNQPPSNTAYWDSFCSAMATRYAPRGVKYWEIWNEVNYTSYWSGSQAQLATLVRRASQVIKGIDAAAKILAPTVQEPETSGTGLAYLNGWMGASDGAAGTGKDWMDICSIHMYPPKYNFSIHAQQYDNVRSALDTAGKTSVAVWNTETGVLQGDGVTPSVKAKWLRRSLALSAAKGVQRYAWYAYDNDTMAMTSQEKDAWQEVRGVLLSGPITNCAILPDERVCITVNGKNYTY